MAGENRCKGLGFIINVDIKTPKARALPAQRLGVTDVCIKKSKAPRNSGASDFSCHLTTSGSSYRKRTVHVIVGGCRSISRNGCVIDHDRSAGDQVKPAADACTRGSGRAEFAREACTVCA
jgi:hypothetical protein